MKKLKEFTHKHLLSFGHNGYTSNEVYKISKEEKTNEINFKLKSVPLEIPFVKNYPSGNEALDKYNKIISQGFSFGAFENDSDEIAGAVIAEHWRWNNSVNIELIEVAETCRGKGIGSLLVNHLEKFVKKNKFRLISLETQNTNIKAINFYRKNGFEISGLNLFLYDEKLNEDEVAIYMTKKVL